MTIASDRTELPQGMWVASRAHYTSLCRFSFF